MITINVKATKIPRESIIKLELIFFKTGYNRVPKSLGIKGEIQEWDERSQLFKTDLRTLKNQEKIADNLRKNQQIQSLIQKYMDAAEQLDLSGVEWGPKEWSHYFDIKETAVKNEPKKSIADAFDMYIKKASYMQKNKNGEIISSISTMNFYSSVKNCYNAFALKTYNKELSDLTPDRLDEQFVIDFISYMQNTSSKRNDNQVYNNDLCVKLSYIQTVVKYAITHGMPEFDLAVFEPYKRFTIKKPYSPAPLTDSEMQKIEQHIQSIPVGSPNRMRLDMFLFTFYTGGMSPVDVAFLKKDCIKGDQIVYERMKCHNIARPFLIDKAREIIDRYENKKSNYVFPIIEDWAKTESEKRKLVYNFKICVNRALEKVEEQLNLKKKITWYTARSSFITKMVQSGFNVMEIAEMAGNSPTMIHKHYFTIVDRDGTKKKLDSIL